MGNTADKGDFFYLKFFDTCNTIDIAVYKLSQFYFDFLTVHRDLDCRAAANKGRDVTGLKFLPFTFLISLNRTDLNQALIKNGEVNNKILTHIENE